MNILLIDSFCHSHSVLASLGHHLTNMLTRSRVLQEDLREIYHNTIVLDDDAEVEEFAYIAEALHARKPFDRVVSYNDRLQGIAYRVARKLKIPSNVDIDLLRLTVNKHEMRKFLVTNDFSDCKFRVANRKNLLKQIESLGYPSVIKPVDGEASDGVYKVMNQGELPNILKAIERSKRQAFLIEELLEGREFSVETISEEGKHTILAITGKYKYGDSCVEIGHQIPADIPKEEQESITNYVLRLLDKLGFKNGPSHTELILTEKGPEIIETHTRFAGDRIPELVELSTGIDYYKLAALQSIGQPIAGELPEKVIAKYGAAIWYHIEPVGPNMVVSKIENEESLRDLSYVYRLRVLRREGVRGCSQLKNSLDRNALAITIGIDAEEALSRARQVIRKLEYFYRYHKQDD